MELLRIENEYDSEHVLTFTKLEDTSRYPILMTIEVPILKVHIAEFQISLEEVGKLIVALTNVLVSKETK